jgi:hypothetical protein
MMLDVIEHIEHDLPALRASASAIAHGGRLLVTVPANPRLWSAHDVRNRHYRRYTDETLSSVITEAGLKVELLTHFNSRLYPMVWLHRHLSGDHSGRELKVPNVAINRVLRRVFAGERNQLQRGYGRGLSLLAVASRN